MLGKDAVEYFANYSPNKHFCIVVWQSEDIIHRGKERGIEVKQKDADEIVERMEMRHDATMGISWDTIDVYLDELREKYEAEGREKVSFS
jgi:hypothetical protein